MIEKWSKEWYDAVMFEEQYIGISIDDSRRIYEGYKDSNLTEEQIAIRKLIEFIAQLRVEVKDLRDNAEGVVE